MKDPHEILFSHRLKPFRNYSKFRSKHYVFVKTIDNSLLPMILNKWIPVHCGVQESGSANRLAVSFTRSYQISKVATILISLVATLLQSSANKIRNIVSYFRCWAILYSLLSSLLILYSRELLLYSIFYSETRYSTRILLKSIEKF